jgi:hypothetical protein
MKRLAILLSILVFSISQTNSQEDALPSSRQARNNNNSFTAVPAELKTRQQSFFNDLLDNKITEGYDNLLNKSPIKKKQDELKSLINQTKRAFELYGNLQGYEPVSAEFVTSSYLRLRYLGLHSRYPMRWIFTYYKSPDQGWIITNVKFDDLSDYFFIDE